jgi:hypothetical protein
MAESRLKALMPAFGAVARWAGALLCLGLAAWAELAIWFQAPLAPMLRMIVALIFAAAFLALAFSLLTGRALMWTVPPAVLLGLTLALWWSTILPSDNRDWRPDVSRTAEIAIRGDDLIVRNVRTFDWTGAETAPPRWEDRLYALSDLRSLDLFVSTWGDERIAHLMPSFVFGNGPPLVLSIEIRRERSEEYSPLAGFFKKYELALVAADESDIIKVRTNHRDETVRRFVIDVKPENAARLIAQYAALSQDLQQRPRFYHTIWTNCSTTIYTMLRAISPQDFPLDYRVLVTGYIPQYLHSIGFIDPFRPFAETLKGADITARARAADTAGNFSAAIRR